MTLDQFQKLIWNHYKKYRRDFPWRDTTDPYRILVSEIMLQQTQTDRVVPKYKSFLKKFPTTKALAKASTSDVLKEWQGLGYNRRALNLKRAAETIVSDLGGTFPASLNELDALPGVGPYTAGALFTFAYNKPAIFIETNIRSVFLYHFFKNKKAVSDKLILKKIEEVLPKTKHRDWYYALMDYGAHLKSSGLRNNAQSKHYTKQSRFEGSNRQIRSNILKLLLEKPQIKLPSIVKTLGISKELASKNLLALQKEGFLSGENR